MPAEVKLARVPQWTKQNQNHGLSPKMEEVIRNNWRCINSSGSSDEYLKSDLNGVFGDLGSSAERMRETRNDLPAQIPLRIRKIIERKWIPFEFFALFAILYNIEPLASRSNEKKHEKSFWEGKMADEAVQVLHRFFSKRQFSASEENLQARDHEGDVHISADFQLSSIGARHFVLCADLMKSYIDSEKEMDDSVKKECKECLRMLESFEEINVEGFQVASRKLFGREFEDAVSL